MTCHNPVTRDAIDDDANGEQRTHDQQDQKVGDGRQEIVPL